ncbi:protein-L-histidine N-pros-methyltransferase isoform X1 [Hydra vulgaris]|uniref:protein-L-histidine N-pros-methyltransferase isoform X1 n=1 Tax=Hydra vulgaris TaxID=6087 RepID=UPI000640DBDD|nr:protein-L-histidine N-pros-methyltransferase [Hydra vulgaris]
MTIYARNPLIHSYLGKLAERNQPVDYSQWYSVNTEKLSRNVALKFEEQSFDAGTKRFLDNCYKKSDYIFTQFFHSIARTFLGWFMSMTTVNGLLNRGSMFVFSEQQFLNLLNVNDTWHAESFIDLGAGDGKVTEDLLHLFDKKYATEQSPTMQWRLKEKGFVVLDIDKWQKNEKYSIITALNLLDRIDEPMKLLQEIHTSLQPDGVVVLAIVLPYNPCYERGPSFGPPSEELQVKGRTIEAQIQSLHDDIFKAVGFEVIKFTRLPYLCEGDLYNDYFVLNDIVFVLKKSKNL